MPRRRRTSRLSAAAPLAVLALLAYTGFRWILPPSVPSDADSTRSVPSVPVPVPAPDSTPAITGCGDELPGGGTFEADRSAHAPFGFPEPSDNRFRFRPAGAQTEVEGITILRREAFTVGHYNRMKTPAWVAMRWSGADLARSERARFGRPEFTPDQELPAYARTGKDLDFPTHRLERGHMARDADLEAWGADAVAEGMRMSNIVPQLQGKNHRVWGELEDQHRYIVDPARGSGIDTCWIVSGPYYLDHNGDGAITESDPDRIGPDRVARPDGTYKVIAWLCADGSPRVRAYAIPQEAEERDLRQYLRPVDTVESLTGLDFLPRLPDAPESALESAAPNTLW